VQFILSHWPLTFTCIAMVVAAVIDGWKLKVPNWLTLPLILSGWLLGLCHDLGFLVGPDGAGVGGIGASIAGTALGFILLFPVYSIGGMGAGDVKMQMGFGAWVGAFYGLNPRDNHPGALWIVFYAFCLAVCIGGVLGLAMMLLRGQLRRNLANTRTILSDLVGSSGVSEVADKATQRKPTMHLLPYGIPLCLGFISYLIYLHNP
jgi:prepilin peptidase CpaA